MQRLGRLLSYLLITVAAALAFFALALTVRLALGDPYAGPTAALHPENLLAPLHTYLFRLALSTTLWLALGVTVAALLLGSLLGRAVAWQTTPGPAMLLLAAWLLPGPLAGLLWRPPFNALDWLAAAPAARFATGLVLVWRLAPLAGLLLGTLHGRAGRTAAAAAVVYSVLVDAGTGLLLTRGEPFNAAHTWATWLLLQLWAARAWAGSAVMAGGLAALAALVSAAGFATSVIPSGARNPSASADATQRDSSSPALHCAQGRLRRNDKVLPILRAWTVALLWLLLPWLPWLRPLTADAAWGIAGFANAGGLYWLGSWLAASCLAAALGLISAAAFDRATPGLRRGGLLIAAAWLPLWPVPLAYLRQVAPGLGSPWTLALITGLCFSGPATAALAIRTRWPRLLWAAAWTGIGLAHSFAWELVLDAPPRWLLPATGVARRLGDAAVAPAAQAVGLYVGLGFALVSAVVLIAALRTSANNQTVREAARFPDGD